MEKSNNNCEELGKIPNLCCYIHGKIEKFGHVVRYS
jgi:hypothetical protein